MRAALRGALPGLLVLLACSSGWAGEGSAEAARPDPGAVALAWEHRDGDFVLRQYEVRSLAQLSTLIGAGDEAIVVDPMRDVDVYVRDAKALGLKITRVVLTHTHVDFVAGHAELAAQTGATVVTAADLDGGEARWRWASTLLTLRALEGGPRDALLLQVGPARTPAAPAFVLTVDACLIGTVGGPEDVGAGPAPLHVAAQAYDAVQTLRMLPDETRILPAHGRGRFGGRVLAPYTVSTVARERATNAFFGIDSRSAFLGRLLDLRVSGPPAAARIARLNEGGPPRLDVDAPPARIAPSALAALEDPWIVDVREHEAYAAGHVPGAVNIARSGPLEPWAAVVLPPDARIVLVGETADTQDAVRRLHRIGTRSVEGVLRGGMAAWVEAGLPVRRSEVIAPEDLARRRAAGIEPLLVDVRSAAEHAERRIADCVSAPLEEPRGIARLLQPDVSCLMICKTGYRSAIAVGLAERAGVRAAANLAGGVKAWEAAGLPVIGSAAPAAGR